MDDTTCDRSMCRIKLNFEKVTLFFQFQKELSVLNTLSAFVAAAAAAAAAADLGSGAAAAAALGSERASCAQALI